MGPTFFGASGMARQGEWRLCRLLTTRSVRHLRAGVALIGILRPASVRAGDGLFDDDETSGYGANSVVFDTDGDGVGDGQEIYNRDNGLGGNADPLVNENAAPPPPALVRGVNERTAAASASIM